MPKEDYEKLSVKLKGGFKFSDLSMLFTWQRYFYAPFSFQVRTLKLKRESGLLRCPMFLVQCAICIVLKILLGKWLKMLEGILNTYAPAAGSMLVFFKYRALQLFSAAKSYHHQLQVHVKQAMKSDEVTAVPAHEELIFIVASVLVAFPVMSAYMLLLPQFSWLEVIIVVYTKALVERFQSKPHSRCCYKRLSSQGRSLS